MLARSIELQMAVFAALMEAQASGANQWNSWDIVSRQFGIGLAEVVSIEEAGIQGRWPPLGYVTLAELLAPMMASLEPAEGGADRNNVTG